MAHGYFDYGVSRAVPTVHATPDMAEEAVRLGAVSSVDRRGNVIWYDDFEPATLKWFIGGANYTARKSTTYARSSDYSIYMKTAAETPTQENISRNSSYLVPSRIGVEFWFRVGANAGMVNLWCVYSDGAMQYTPQMRFNMTTLELQYLPLAGPWQPLFTAPVALETWMFYPLKFVFDMNTNEYVRCMFYSQEHDMTGLGITNAFPVFTPYINTQIRIETLTDDAVEIWVDDVILTQNEP